MENYKILEKYITVGTDKDSRKLAYTDCGDSENKDIVICVHGLARNSRDFDYLSKYLSDKYRVLSIDMAGRGRSDFLKDHSLYNYDTYISDVLFFLEKLDLLGKNINWIGSSMGGLIGLMLHKHDSTIIKKIVLNDIGPYMPLHALKRIAKYVGIVPVFKTLSDLENHLRMILQPFGITKEEHWKHLAKYGHRIHEGKFTLGYDPGISKNFNSVNDLEGDVDWWHLWDDLSIPGLVIRGKNSDILSPEVFKRMLLKQNIVGVEIPNTGHIPSLMEESQMSIIKDFIQRSTY